MGHPLCGSSGSFVRASDTVDIAGVENDGKEQLRSRLNVMYPLQLNAWFGLFSVPQLAWFSFTFSGQPRFSEWALDEYPAKIRQLDSLYDENIRYAAICAKPFGSDLILFASLSWQEQRRGKMRVGDGNPSKCYCIWSHGKPAH